MYGFLDLYYVKYDYFSVVCSLYICTGVSIQVYIAFMLYMDVYLGILAALWYTEKSISIKLLIAL
jgi:hypothetical protein